MLQAASNIAPRGVYVCGNTTTTSGLTVTLVKEGGSGDFALEAGALVLADQGKISCLLITEITGGLKITGGRADDCTTMEMQPQPIMVYIVGYQDYFCLG
jgi:hypothetical protein